MIVMICTEQLSGAYYTKVIRKKKRNIHIYYSDGKAYGEKQEIKQKIRRLKKYLDGCVGKECVAFGPEIMKYFYLNFEQDGKPLKLAEENASAVEKELSLAGYLPLFHQKI